MSKPRRRTLSYPGVFAYETRSGTRYRYAFDLPPGIDGQRRTKTKRGFPSAEDAWEAMQAAKRELRLYGEALPDETLEQYFARWMRDTQHGRRPPTNRAYRNAWQRFPETFRALPLTQVTPSQVRAVYAEIVTRYAPATARETRNVLAMIMGAALRERVIPYNPTAGIRLPVSRDQAEEASFDPRNVWSVEEAQRFLAATAAHPDHCLWRVLLDAGLRIGEALALTWDDVDLERRVLRVRRTMTSDAAGRDVVGRQPKTPASRREVPLLRATVEHLRRHQTAQKIRRVQCGPLWQDHNLVFDAGDGSHIGRGAPAYRFRQAVKRAGVRPLTLHGLRHTMAVTWLQAGKSPAVVQKRLGHKSSAFTLDIYAKVTSDWQERDADDVEAFIKETG